MSEAIEKQLVKKFAHVQSDDLTPLKWADSNFARSARAGHLVVRIWKRTRSTTVYPPARILHRRKYKNSEFSRGYQAMFHLLEATHLKPMPLKTFGKLTYSSGLGRMGEYSEMQVKDPDIRRTVLGLSKPV